MRIKKDHIYEYKKTPSYEYTIVKQTALSLKSSGASNRLLL